MSYNGRFALSLGGMPKAVSDNPLDKKIEQVAQELDGLMKQKHEADIAECKNYLKDNDLSDMYCLDYGRLSKLDRVTSDNEEFGVALRVKSLWIALDRCEEIYDDSEYCSNTDRLKEEISKYKKDEALKDLWALATATIKSFTETRTDIFKRSNKLYEEKLKGELKERNPEKLEVHLGELSQLEALRKARKLKPPGLRPGRQRCENRLKMLSGKRARKYGLAVANKSYQYDKSLTKILSARMFRDPQSNLRSKYPKLRKYKDNYDGPEFRRKPRVPVSTEVMNSICKQCVGFCCDRFFLTGNKMHLMEWAVGHDQKSALFYSENFVEKEPEVARKAGSYGSVAYTCLKFDKETKLCTAYEDRPDMCKSYRCSTVMKGQLPTKRAEDYSPIP